MYTLFQEFKRLRFGIDRPEQKKDVLNYVLSKFNTGEQEHLEVVIDNAIDKLKAHVLQNISQNCVPETHVNSTENIDTTKVLSQSFTHSDAYEKWIIGK